MITGFLLLLILISQMDFQLKNKVKNTKFSLKNVTGVLYYMCDSICNIGRVFGYDVK